MMVPSNRLLLWVGLCGVPAATLIGLSPRAAPVAGFFLAALLLVVLLDLVLSMSRLDPIAISLPNVVRLTRGREGTLEITVENPSSQLRLLRVGLALPHSFVQPSAAVTVELPRDIPNSSTSWHCTPSRRGRFSLTLCRLETSSRLGFWEIRSSRTLQCEIRVYPDLRRDRRQLAGLFLNRGSYGIHAQRQVGRGREFEKLREYIPGDGSADIHWKATAKRGKPVTKVFRIERTQQVYVVIDGSRLSGRELSPSEQSDPAPPARSEPEAVPPDRHAGTAGAGAEVVLERLVTAGLFLGLAAERQGDLFGLVTFSDRVDRFIKARNGRAHHGACRDALYTVQPRVVNPNFEELFSFLRIRLRRRALLLFLTSLDDPALAETFVKEIDIVARHHLIVVSSVRPVLARPLFSDDNVDSVGDIYENLASHLVWSQARELKSLLHRKGIRFEQLGQDGVSLQLIAQYLSVKNRQLL